MISNEEKRFIQSIVNDCVDSYYYEWTAYNIDPSEDEIYKFIEDRINRNDFYISHYNNDNELSVEITLSDNTTIKSVIK